MMPAEVTAAVAAMLEGIARRDLAVRARRMSDLYRSGAGTAAAVRDQHDALAYAVARMPATFAAVERTARETVRRLAPATGPASLIDLGAGPGTATLAVLAALGGEARTPSPRVLLVERNAAFRRFAADLLGRLGIAAETVAESIAALGSKAAEVDWALISYVLVELDEARAREAVRTAARLARTAVLLVEPGTPQGFARIREARDELMAAGFAIVAPCPGNVACPMQGSDWCHFSVRLARTRDHKFLKDADVPFEDERFAYVAAARPGARPAAARILAEPARDRGGVNLKLCTHEGLAERRIARGDKAAFKAARALDWGDALDP